MSFDLRDCHDTDSQEEDIDVENFSIMSRPPSTRLSRSHSGSVSFFNRSNSGMDVEGNPLVDSASKNSLSVMIDMKIENLTDAVLINSAQMENIIAVLQATRTNIGKVDYLEIEKKKYLFTSLDLLRILDTTPSVQTRITLIESISPRLIDPKSQTDKLLAMFRFSKEKSQVEEALKLRATALEKNRYSVLPKIEPSTPTGFGTRAGGRGRGGRTSIRLDLTGRGGIRGSAEMEGLSSAPSSAASSLSSLILSKKDRDDINRGDWDYFKRSIDGEISSSYIMKESEDGAAPRTHSLSNRSSESSMSNLHQQLNDPENDSERNTIIDDDDEDPIYRNNTSFLSPSISPFSSVSLNNEEGENGDDDDPRQSIRTVTTSATDTEADREIETTTATRNAFSDRTPDTSASQLNSLNKFYNNNNNTNTNRNSIDTTDDSDDSRPNSLMAPPSNNNNSHGNSSNASPAVQLPSALSSHSGNRPIKHVKIVSFESKEDLDANNSNNNGNNINNSNGNGHKMNGGNRNSHQTSETANNNNNNHKMEDVHIKKNSYHNNNMNSSTNGISGELSVAHVGAANGFPHPPPPPTTTTSPIMSIIHLHHTTTDQDDVSSPTPGPASGPGPKTASSTLLPFLPDNQSNTTVPVAGQTTSHTSDGAQSRSSGSISTGNTAVTGVFIPPLLIQEGFFLEEVLEDTLEYWEMKADMEAWLDIYDFEGEAPQWIESDDAATLPSLISALHHKVDLYPISRDSKTGILPLTTGATGAVLPSLVTDVPPDHRVSADVDIAESLSEAEQELDGSRTSASSAKPPPHHQQQSNGWIRRRLSYRSLYSRCKQLASTVAATASSTATATNTSLGESYYLGRPTSTRDHQHQLTVGSSVDGTSATAPDAILRKTSSILRLEESLDLTATIVVQTDSGSGSASPLTGATPTPYTVNPRAPLLPPTAPYHSPPMASHRISTRYPQSPVMAAADAPVNRRSKSAPGVTSSPQLYQYDNAPITGQSGLPANKVMSLLFLEDEEEGSVSSPSLHTSSTQNNGSIASITKYGSGGSAPSTGNSGSASPKLLSCKSLGKMTNSTGTGSSSAAASGNIGAEGSVFIQSVLSAEETGEVSQASGKPGTTRRRSITAVSDAKLVVSRREQFLRAIARTQKENPNVTARGVIHAFTSSPVSPNDPAAAAATNPAAPPHPVSLPHPGMKRQTSTSNTISHKRSVTNTLLKDIISPLEPSAGLAEANTLGMDLHEFLSMAAEAPIDFREDGLPLFRYAELVRRNFNKQYDSLRRAELEEHLADADFIKVFGTSKEVFRSLPLWRRNERKKACMLF